MERSPLATVFCIDITSILEKELHPSNEATRRESFFAFALIFVSILRMFSPVDGHLSMHYQREKGTCCLGLEMDTGQYFSKYVNLFYILEYTISIPFMIFPPF